MEVAQLTEVSKNYGAVRALDEVSFELRRGEQFALLGANGAGKSTTTDLLLGLTDPDAGSVTLFGRSPARAVRAGRVGAMLQRGGIPSETTVTELINFTRRVYPRPRRLASILRTAGLEHLTRRRVERLSGGEVQRVRFALAIAGDPELLFLDEPTAGMDVETRQSFWACIRNFSDQGRTVVFATHDLEEADAVADRILVLLKGTVAALGPAAEIKAGVADRRIRATVPGVDEDRLRGLPGVTDVTRHGERVHLSSRDADTTVRALLASEWLVRDLEVTGASLQEAFLALANEDQEPSRT